MLSISPNSTNIKHGVIEHWSWANQFGQKHVPSLPFNHCKSFQNSENPNYYLHLFLDTVNNEFIWKFVLVVHANNNDIIDVKELHETMTDNMHFPETSNNFPLTIMHYKHALQQKRINQLEIELHDAMNQNDMIQSKLTHALQSIEVTLPNWAWICIVIGSFWISSLITCGFIRMHYSQKLKDLRHSVVRHSIARQTIII